MATKPVTIKIKTAGGFDILYPATHIDQVEGLAGELLSVYAAIDDKQDLLISGTNIKTINGTSLLGAGDIVTPKGVHYIEGNTTGTAGTWLGTQSEITEYYNGLTVVYRIGIAGASTTTLNINSLGAAIIYRRYVTISNNTKLTTHYPVGTVVTLTYKDGYWLTTQDYDSTDDYNMRWINNVTAGTSITRYKIIMQGADGRYYPLTIGDTTTEDTKTVSTQEFLLNGYILQYNSNGTTYTVGQQFGSYYLWSQQYTGVATYNFNQLSGWVAGMPIYLKGTIQSNGTFKLDNTTVRSWLTQTLPTTEDNFVYIKLGYMHNTTSAYTLTIDHPIYEFKNGKLRLYETNDPRPASDVNAWAKAATKPTYTPKEVDYNGTVSDFNNALSQGQYYFAGENMTNGYTTGWIYGKLIVEVSTHDTHNLTSNWIWQTAYDTSGRIYKRYKVNAAAWSTWYLMYTDGMIYDRGNRVYSANNNPSFANIASKPTTLFGYGITDALASSLKGAVNGLAELGADGKVPASQLPSYVDDVLEYASLANFPGTGETGKIYVALDNGKIYRWSGSAYTEISASLALGETLSTAYRGDRGKIAYDHSQAAHAPSNAQKNSDITKAEIEAVLTGDITTHTHSQYLTALPAHDHTILKEASSIIYGIPGLQWFDLSSTGGSGLSGSTPQNPTTEWYHHLIMNHANAGGYYVDLAMGFHEDKIFFRRMANGSLTSFRELLHTGNFVAGTDYQAALSAGTQAEIEAGTETAQRTWAPNILKAAIQALSDLDTNTWRPIDDVPVNGVTDESISSNWAYDHNAGTGNGKHVPAIGSAGQFLAHNGAWATPPDTNTWNANSKDVAGYVAAPGAVANKVWKTDGAGNPAWRDDADTVYTLTKAAVEAVLTGAISTHSHALPDHTHGKITNDGKIGSLAGKLVYTTLYGELDVFPAPPDDSLLTMNTSGIVSVIDYISLRTAIGAAASSHTHGQITNDGKITTAVAIASGDHLIIADSSDSDTLKQSTLAFGTGTTTYLRNDGTWGTPTNTTYSAMTVAEGKAGTATTSRVVRADYLRQIIEHHSAPRITAVTASFTTTSAHNGRMIRVTSNSITITLLPWTGIEIGDEIHFLRTTSGTVTFAQGSGQAIQSTKGVSPKIANQYGAATAKYVAANTWAVFGDLS